MRDRRPFASRSNLLGLHLLLGLLFYNAIAIPFHIAFGVFGALEVAPLFLIAIDLLLPLEVLLRFRGVLHFRGAIVDSPARIVGLVWRQGLRAEIVCFFPYDLVHVLMPGLVPVAALPFLHLPRLLLVPRMIAHFRPIEETLHVDPSVLRLAKLVILMLLVNHWVGCTWYQLGRIEAGRSAGWLFEDGLVDAPRRTGYIRSVYWSLTTITTVGYGDIAPRTDSERVFAMFMMLVGVASYGYLIGNMSSLLSNLDMRSQERRERIAAVGDELRTLRLPADLRYRIRDYFDYVWARSGAGHKTLLEELPGYLRDEVLAFVNRDAIERVPLFAGCEAGVLHDLVTRLQPVVCLPGNLVIRAGHIGREMYFLTRGVMEVLDEDGRKVRNLLPGDFFGEIALLYPERRTASIRARTTCDLFVLTQSDLEAVAASDPGFKAAIARVAAERYRTIKGPEEPA